MNTQQVVMYTLPNCVRCDQTKRHFARLGVEVKPVNIMEDEEARLRLKSKGFGQAPVVELGDEVWSGYEPGRIEAAAKTLLAKVGSALGMQPTPVMM